MESYLSTDEVPPEFEENARLLAELYRVRTAECLTVADLTRPVSIPSLTNKVFINKS